MRLVRSSIVSTLMETIAERSSNNSSESSSRPDANNLGPASQPFGGNPGLQGASASIHVDADVVYFVILHQSFLH